MCTTLATLHGASSPSAADKRMSALDITGMLRQHGAYIFNGSGFGTTHSATGVARAAHRL